MRNSVDKSQYRQQVGEYYKKEVESMAWEQDFDLIETDDTVLKNGEVVGSGREKWFKAWHFLKYGTEGFVIY